MVNDVDDRSLLPPKEGTLGGEIVRDEAMDIEARLFDRRGDRRGASISECCNIKGLGLALPSHM